MGSIFGSRSIAARLYILVGAFVVGLLVIGAVGLDAQWRLARAARVQSLTALAEVARAIVDRQHSLAAQGKLSEAEAKAQAAAEITAMRYGHGDYIIIATTAGITVAHPNPAQVGKDVSHATDANGFNWTADITPRAIRDNVALVSYNFPRAGGSVPLEKVSVYAYYEPWQWFIGAGAYMDDLTGAFWSSATIMLGTAGLALLVVGGIAVQVIRSTASPLRRLGQAMVRLAGGDATVAVPEAALGGEVGVMGQTILVFREATAAKAQIEAQAAEQRDLNEQARQKIEAERAAAAETQRAVVAAVGGGLAYLAKGDLLFRLPNPFAAEYEELRSNFNAAVEQMEELIRGIVGNAGAIQSGTEEIRTASDDLSRRTEQQAASLEETAAALAEITTTVCKTAESSKHVQAVVSRTKEGAEQSGEVVRQAVAAMGGIEQSSQKIGDIIGVIDEIAFQTNLLALNAGVEAARAGDAGRGFAVVASEVRALAQRSAEAAKEIKALISTSAQQVGTGVKLVGETGRALSRIVSEVGDVTTAISEIAASAQEQAAGLAEVNTAINQMDQVTQQNAAMVEQSTAASHSLAQETAELVRLTERFQIGAAPSGLAAGTSVQPLHRSAKLTPRATKAVALKVVRHGESAALRKPTLIPASAAEGWTEF